MFEQAYRRVVIFQIDKQADGFSISATARQFITAKRVELPICRKQDKLVRRLALCRKGGPIALLKFQAFQIVDLAFHRPNPAFFRHDYRDGFFRDERSGQINVQIRCNFKSGAATTVFGFGAVSLA